MSPAVRAGVAYFAVVFAFGFVLGIVRVFWLAPWLGALFAVAIEVPIMLTASWWICEGLLNRLKVPDTASARALMGGSAFVLLMLAEFSLATFVLGQSPSALATGFREPHAVLGILGQIGFALMPLWQRRKTID